MLKLINSYTDFPFLYFVRTLPVLLFFSFVIYFIYIGINTANAEMSIVNVIPQPNTIQNSLQELEYNAANGNMYISLSGSSGPVAVLNSYTNTFNTDTIPIRAPAEMAFNYANGDMYVVSEESINNTSYVSVIESSTNNVIATTPVGEIPVGIAYNPSNGNIYVANLRSGTISVIDSSNVVIDTITVNGSPAGIAYNPSNGNMYITQYANPGSVFVLNTTTNTVTATIPVGGLPLTGIAYNYANGNMYVSNIGSNTVSVIDGSNNVIATIPTGEFPLGITFNPSNGKMYVLNLNSGNLAEIDSFSHTVTDTLPIDGSDIAFNPSNGMLYVTSSNKASVYVISTSLNQQSNANCPTSNVQHWDKIVFKITSPEVARFVDLPHNTELDVKIQGRDAVRATELKSEIARSIGIPHEFRNSIEIVDNGYAVICSPPLPTVENITNTKLTTNMTDDAYPENISMR